MKKLDIIKKNFSSGFEAQVIIRPHFVKKFMGIIVDFGGSDPQRLPGGAHFLEHKLFAKKHGDISHRLNLSFKMSKTLRYRDMFSRNIRD